MMHIYSNSTVVGSLQEPALAPAPAAPAPAAAEAHRQQRHRHQKHHRYGTAGGGGAHRVRGTARCVRVLALAAYTRTCAARGRHLQCVHTRLLHCWPLVCTHSTAQRSDNTAQDDSLAAPVACGVGGDTAVHTIPIVVLLDRALLCNKDREHATRSAAGWRHRGGAG